MAPKPKILVVNKFYPPWTGGVERIAARLVENLKDEFDFRVLTCRAKGPTSIIAGPGYGLIKSSSLGVRMSMPLSPSFLHHYRESVRDRSLVHFHEPFPLGTLAGLVHGFPRAVVTYHADIRRQRVLGCLYSPWQRLLLQRARFVMPTSTDLAHGSPRLMGLGQRIRVVPLGIPDPAETRGEEPAGLIEELRRRAGGRTVLLAVGRLVPYKGHQVLLRAMTRTRGVALFVVGEGPLRQALERSIREHNLEDIVFLEGRVPGRNLPAYYRAADIFALPSIAPNEAFGLVQLEAMSHALPVINTDLPTGVPWVAPHGRTGLTVRPGDGHGLAKAIMELAGNRELRETMGRKGRERFLARFTEDRMVAGVRSAYHLALASPDREGEA